MSLKHAILVQLEIEPSSGYDLLKHFNKGLGYFWNAKHQQIYQQLKILSEQGLVLRKTVNQNNKPDKKVYKITEEGVEELKSWLSGNIKPSKVNEALLVKLYGGHLVEHSNIIEEIQRHLAFHQQTLQKLELIEAEYQALNDAGRQKYQLPYLTLRRGILSEKAWIEWAEESLESLKK